MAPIVVVGVAKRHPRPAVFTQSVRIVRRSIRAAGLWSFLCATDAVISEAGFFHLLAGVDEQRNLLELDGHEPADEDEQDQNRNQNPREATHGKCRAP